MARLDGKVALISGGARGQGAAEALLFAQEGAKVVIGDILDEEGKRLEARIAELGGDAVYVHLDVTSSDGWDAAVQTALDRYGKLDILVNNAGILLRKGLEDTGADEWDRVLDVNGKGVFLGAKAAIPAMRRRAAALSSTSRPSPALWAADTALPPIRVAKARCACSPSQSPSNTRPTTSAATQSIPE